MSGGTTSFSSFRDDALGRLDAVGISARISGGEISAREAVGAAIERAKTSQPALNAVAFEDYDRALERCESRYAGVFSGVPTFIKDSDAYEGLPTRFGSHAIPNTPDSKNSHFVKQLLATGLVPLGKSTTPEFGLTGTTEALVYGPTRNPWNVEHSTGGSSGGSAALVAAGVVPVAHANDGAGSIRIPASCCGVVGMKPTRGRTAALEHSGIMPVRLVHQGVITRSVRDTALFYAAAEQYLHNSRLPRLGLVERPGKVRLKIGMYTSSPHGVSADSECVDAVLNAAKLCESLGHRVEEIRSPVDEQLLGDFFVYWAALAYSIARFGKVFFHRDFDAGKLDQFSQGLVRHFSANMRDAPGAVWRLRRFVDKYKALMRRYDVLLTPTLGMPPPRIGYIGPEVEFEEAIERVQHFFPFTPIQNVTGAPAITLPLAMSNDGLPLGVHFAAPFAMDRRLLELALELEEASPWPVPGEA